jgi:hypothetical protein
MLTKQLALKLTGSQAPSYIGRWRSEHRVDNEELFWFAVECEVDVMVRVKQHAFWFT